MRKPWARIVSLVLALASGAAGAREQVVLGEEGATIELPVPWERVELIPALGPHQFRGRLLGATFQLAILPQSVLLVEEADFRDHLETITRSMASSGAVGVERTEFRFERIDDGFGLGSRGISGRENGVDVRYQVAVIGADDLSFLFMLWGLDRQASGIEAECSRLARSVRFPGEGSAWSERRREREHVGRVHDHVVRVRARGSLLRPAADTGDAAIALKASDGSLALYVLPSYQDDADRVLDDALSLLDSPGRPLVESARDDLVVGGRPARTVIGAARDGAMHYQLVAFDLGGGRYVDLRIEVQRPPDAREELRRSLLESVEIEAPRELDAWPDPIESEPAPPPARGPAIVALLAGAVPIHSIPSDAALVSVDAGGRAAGVAEGEAWSLAPDGTRTGHGGASAIVLDEDGVWLRDGVGTVRWVGADGTERVGPRTYALWPGPSGALAVLDERRARAFGFEDALWLGDSTLLELTGGASLDSREVPPARVESIDVVAAAPGRRRALIVRSRRFPDGDLARVVEVDLDTGATTDLGAWRSVEKLAPADGGAWLVTGARAGGARGIHLVSRDRAELLLRGRDFRGLALRDGRLIVRTSLAPPATDGADALLSLPLSLARAVGPRCGPLDATAVQSIGEATFRDVGLDPRSITVLATRDRVRAVAAAARRRAAAEGHPIGTTPRAIDALLHESYADPALGREGRLVLTAWFAEVLLDDGATWVDGERASEPRHAADHAARNPFAIGYLVHEVALSTVFDRDGWSSPTRRLPSSASGRVLLVGVDRDAVVRAVAERDDVRFETGVSAADLETLEGLFAESPENTALRGDAYRRLAGAGALEVLRRLAAPRARAEPPEFADLRAWLAARVALELPDHADPLLDDTRAAVATFPDAPSLYLLLGRVWEETDDEDGDAKARRCYRRALELQEQGGIAEDARAALQRLEEKEQGRARESKGEQERAR